MHSRNRFPAALALAALSLAALASGASAATKTPKAGYRYPTRLKADNRPLPTAVAARAATSHAPYASGDCSLCHSSSDARNPGRILKAGNALCYECHQEFEEILSRKHQHPPALEACTSCHNPHDSRQQGLLHAELSSLCLECHEDVRAAVERAKVKHGALTTGRKCANCHNPHGAHIEKLLSALPYDQCVGCHAVNDHVNKLERGRTCRACHDVHASKQLHHVREGVPYGQGGWVLKINFTRTPTGGSCAKTCHDTKTYVNKGLPAVTKRKVRR